MHNKPNHRAGNPRATAPRSDASAIPLTIHDYAAKWAARHDALSGTPAEDLRRADRLLAVLPTSPVESLSGGEVRRG
jgi:hypothetical protein